ncbi:type II toxin-antitoxin system RelE/ParE family toxin [Crocosphaera sp. XPORK-15E]|uniref:type II toxin-antitoxin system RelE family toxin n=1 Tax=Crocosphaera sp. XPORK-15E TaxID=3110247 RepID=UPI002B20F299|nr:type II toxin-antitoxin system RelE/ParE family toxin [Crocosphaera sp. XPORK-15E]MEA5534143.1 type II toxin-antitoxin system RelE/ParE family toxin [Crocosphaera sp. XPORK-15E]
MSYQVELKSSAKRQFKKLSADIQRVILTKLEQLTLNPRPPQSQKMVGEDNTYRIRVGDYRIIYEVFDHRLVVMVIRIGHRREVYRK